MYSKKSLWQCDGGRRGAGVFQRGRLFALLLGRRSGGQTLPKKLGRYRVKTFIYVIASGRVFSEGS